MIMRKHLLIIQGLVFGMVSVCHADNIVTKMFPENGATDVNIDTHLILTMAEVYSIATDDKLLMSDLQNLGLFHYYHFGRRTRYLCHSVSCFEI